MLMPAERPPAETSKLFLAAAASGPNHCILLAPDKALYYALRPTSIADFLQKCGFKGGPPGFLSCFACFAGDMAWDELEQSQYDVKTWIRALDRYHRKHGLTAIPPVIMQEI